MCPVFPTTLVEETVSLLYIFLLFSRLIDYFWAFYNVPLIFVPVVMPCLLYTSDAADDPRVV